MSTIVTFNQNKELQLAEVIPTFGSEQPFTKEQCTKIIDNYLSAIDDYRICFDVSVPSLMRSRREELKKIANIINKNSKEVEIDGQPHIIADGPHAANKLRNAISDSEAIIQSKAIDSLVKSLFIGLFSEYDHFIGELMKVLYAENRSLLKGISREISLTELIEYNDIEAVKNEMLEKEIESLRRESYISQFEQLEKKFGIDKLRHFKEWPEFVEISQRRNLFTHNNGCISQQYLSVCTKAKCNINREYSVGKQLEITGEYFHRAIFVLSKVGFMLAHTLWTKTIPTKARLAGDAMNNSIFLLLKRGSWELATEFGLFGLEQPQLKNIDDITKKIRIINTAIGLISVNQKEAAMKLIDEHDWSSSIRDFRLAVMVLKEDYLAASEFMREIGKKGELIEQMSYHGWPIFKEFSKCSEFKRAYENIYGISFDEKTSEEATIQSEKIMSEEEIGSNIKHRKVKKLKVVGKTTKIKKAK